MTSALETVAAFVKFIIAEDMDGALDHYEQSPDTYSLIEGPSASLAGIDGIRRGWSGWYGAGLRLRSVDFIEGPSETNLGDLSWITAVADTRVTTPTGDREIRFAVTWILRNDGVRWRIAHDHYSIPAEDPYGVGDWAHP
ncbi:YybH family protein [Actinomadura rubrisoli]|uniref:SnoaL-like domain-containing protein n=1 Tax=Actinomadura rubrisoli TaxID=2530368 RepID=A0A4R5C3T5_9ACTN|nr:nuclear transport factor 2 family protein [Actinomadura rubrisoli]TDD94341.1 hypothetical protein E1298_07010 [Actinomadura rubrisoli]